MSTEEAQTLEQKAAKVARQLAEAGIETRSYVEVLQESGASEEVIAAVEREIRTVADARAVTEALANDFTIEIHGKPTEDDLEFIRKLEEVLNNGQFPRNDFRKVCAYLDSRGINARVPLSYNLQDDVSNTQKEDFEFGANKQRATFVKVYERENMTIIVRVLSVRNQPDKTFREVVVKEKQVSTAS